MQVALTIAGSDSGGGAGIQADLKTFAARGVFGTSVITAITAQNTLGVQGVLELPVEIVAQQFDSVCSDFEIRAAKIGMLSSVEIIETVAAKLQQWRIPRVVLDPVMIAKGGDRLLREDAVQALVEKLFPHVSIVTPNLPEAETLFRSKILDGRSRDRAAQYIWELAWDARDANHKHKKFCVLVKGGHRVEGGMAGDADEAEDVLFDGIGYRTFSAPRIASKNTHGTGCTFSAAICAELAKGASTLDAVKAAKEYITRAIAQAPQLGHGHGPLQHFPL
jgi:hydroxymethylpyrimidine/phosphomethylpyrimidine kinase